MKAGSEMALPFFVEFNCKSTIILLQLGQGLVGVACKALPLTSSKMSCSVNGRSDDQSFALPLLLTSALPIFVGMMPKAGG